MKYLSVFGIAIAIGIEKWAIDSNHSTPIPIATPTAIKAVSQKSSMQR
jgi:hypothetical protein